MSSLPSIARNRAGLFTLSVLCLAIPCTASAKAHVATKAPPLTKREKAELALDRLSFGPRPGEVEQVEAMGVERWIGRQLHPEKIDDAALETKLDTLPAMRLSTEELIRRFPPPVIRQVAAGRTGVPSDPVEQAVYANGWRIIANAKRIPVPILVPIQTSLACCGCPLPRAGMRC